MLLLLIFAAAVFADGSRSVRAADAEEKQPTFASLKQQYDAEIIEWNGQFDLSREGVDLVECLAEEVVPVDGGGGWPGDAQRRERREEADPLSSGG